MDSPGVNQFDRNKKKRHLTKDDIGSSENFSYISPVAWDPHKGFDINVDDLQLKQFFSKAGVSDRQLRDKDTRDFIYNFINTHGGLDVVKSEVITDTRPKKSPSPSPGPSSNQSLPTPPPGVNQLGRNRKKRHLTKDDIGTPENFIHISHVGWDPHKGFYINVDNPQLKQFFSEAGVSDRQLRDKDTRDFMYDFMNIHGGLDAVKSEVITDTQPKKSPYPAPPPSSNQILPTPPPVSARTLVNRSAPPSSPPNKVVKPPVPAPRSNPPPRLDSIQNGSNQPVTMAVAETIRADKNLKPGENVERKPSVSDSRGDLFNENRQGIELKPDQCNQSPSSGPNCKENSLAEALSNAMKARAFTIHSDSESDSGNSTDDEDE